MLCYVMTCHLMKHTRVGPYDRVLHGDGAHWRHVANTTELLFATPLPFDSSHPNRNNRGMLWKRNPQKCTLSLHAATAEDIK